MPGRLKSMDDGSSPLIADVLFFFAGFSFDGQEQ
jgi:hypothetical protein